MTLICVSIGCSVACFKWRWLADYNVYLHFLFVINLYTIPAIKINLSEMYLSMVCMFEFLLFGTDQVGQLLFITFAHLCLTFGLKCTIYDEKLSLHLVVIKLAMVVGAFVINALLSMMLLYIQSFHSRIKSLAKENTKLLDAMHEGLLILTKSGHESMFCNFMA